MENNNKKKVYQLFGDGRLNFYAPADYSENSPIFNYMKNVIDEIAAKEKQKAEQRALGESAEQFKKRSVLEKILESGRNCLSDSEKTAIKQLIENI